MYVFVCTFSNLRVNAVENCGRSGEARVFYKLQVDADVGNRFRQFSRGTPCGTFNRSLEVLFGVIQTESGTRKYVRSTRYTMDSKTKSV